nr:RNA polymerase-associated protein [Ipomoea batatas]
MMSVNNNNVDIALAMGFSNRTVKTKLNDDSGAGVNAGSGLHIFAAPDPLSELVWTPRKGLSLKRADNSLAKKKPILLWNVAPSNEVSTPPEIISFNGINDQNDIGEGSVNGMENINPAEVDGNDDTNQDKESQRENEEKDLSVLQKIQTIGESERGENCAGENMESSVIKEVSVQNEARLLRNDSLPIEASPTHIKISGHKRKGKGKALSDSDDSNGKMSSSEEGSHESVESCNSAKMFPESKNLEIYEQPLYSGSKRVKTQMQRSVAPTSTIGHGSSFLTWISNMVNGLSKPCQEEVPPLALAVAHSNLGHEGNHNIWSTFAIPEIRISKDDTSAGESKDVVVDDKMIIEVSPTQCPWENDGSDEQIFVSNDKINTSASANVEGVSTKSPVTSQNVALAWEACKSTSAENKASGSLECSKAKTGGCCSCSMCMLRTGNRESSSPSHLSENKTLKNMSDRGSLQSIWITRFSSRDPITALNLADCRDNRDETTNSAKPNPNAQITSEILIYHKGSEQKAYFPDEPGNDILKDMPSYALNDDASVGFDNYEKSIHKLNPTIPFPKFKSSEAMTCLFARRLEAFKHNIPPDARNEATCTKAICLFCGKSGDGFCNCSEATESDAFLAKEEGTYNIIVNHIGCCKEKSGIVTDTNNLAQTPESISVERKARSSDVPENVASNPGENVLKGTGDKETASVPKGAFDAIRRLRLSRGDILKWLDSNAPLSHLDGFFLRLRLGKWEGALGGTGYYIARIAGSQQEYSAKDAKKCISVSICGITCSVGSQYVSNHDFLEDELMAWWCKTSESGGQVPSEDELRLKVEQRMKLGF